MVGKDDKLEQEIAGVLRGEGPEISPELSEKMRGHLRSFASDLASHRYVRSLGSKSLSGGLVAILRYAMLLCFVLGAGSLLIYSAGRISRAGDGAVKDHPPRVNIPALMPDLTSASESRDLQATASLQRSDSERLLIHQPSDQTSRGQDLRTTQPVASLLPDYSGHPADRASIPKMLHPVFAVNSIESADWGSRAMRYALRLLQSSKLAASSGRFQC